MIGGYQLIRRLGAGPRAEVYLGHAGSEGAAAGRRIAAIKLFRSDLERGSIDDEIESLTRVTSAVSSAAGRHLLSLRDIATGADGRPCLILPRLRPTSLARLLAERERLDPGEAVTILAPLSAALGELHSAGVVHGGIRPGAVLFDDGGAPVLGCFGRSSRLRLSSADPTPGVSTPGASMLGLSTFGGQSPATPAQLAEDSRVADDLVGLVTIAVSVLSRVPAVPTTEAGRDLMAWLESAEPALLADTMTAELCDRLFDFADGTPIELAALDEPSPEGAAPLVVVAGHVRPGPARPGPALPGPVLPGLVFPGLVFPKQVFPEIKGEVPKAEVRPGPLARTATRVGLALHKVRRPFWVVGALGLTAVVSAVAVFPSTAATDVGAPSGPATSTAGAAHPTVVPGGAGPTAAAEDEDNERDKSIAGDDPVAAAVALLAARERCMSTLSVLCLDGVDQEGSAALDGDRQVIRSLQEKGTATRERSLADATVELSQRLGDSALMTVTATTGPTSTDANTTEAKEDKSEPTSLLLIKSEAGWRIRDLFRS
jgi:hypothetical protein